MRLIAEEGYNRGTEYVLAPGRVSLGRGEECTIRLVDDGVSRLHARIDNGPTTVTVRDLDSRNGTYPAEDVRGREVALKVLDAGAIGQARRRFEQECEVLRQLDHPRIVAVLTGLLQADGRSST